MYHCISVSLTSHDNVVRHETKSATKMQIIKGELKKIKYTECRRATYIQLSCMAASSVLP